jgi:hypothetical protein
MMVFVFNLPEAYNLGIWEKDILHDDTFRPSEIAAIPLDR